MKSASTIRIVLVTAPDRKTARALAHAALEARLVACANLVPGIESHYRWKGKLERSRETILLFKTTRRRLATLEKLLLAHHPYDTPEIISLAPDSGTRRYLSWILASIN